MSHAMHRDLPDSAMDFVLHIRCTKGVNSDGAGEKLQAAMERLMECSPVAFGNPSKGCSLCEDPQAALIQISEGLNLHVTFASLHDAYNALRTLQTMDTGLSVSIAGPLDDICNMAADLEMTPNSVLLDLGTFGAAPALEEHVSRIVSLCGHMRIAPLLVRQAVVWIREGRASPEDAASRIGSICRCGCFNTSAAAGVLRQAADADA